MQTKPYIIALVLVSCILQALLPIGPVSVAAHDQAQPESWPAHLYLPFASGFRPPPVYPPMQPIWAEHGGYSSRELALFRKSVSLQTARSDLALHVFADTRFEIYLDGVLIGRGPAVFSHETQEYDVYDLPLLGSGDHEIAALVQYAPIARRSESTRPALYARLVDQTGGVLATTDETWKATRSSAWASDSTLVHSFGLIGPTELLDLSYLPVGWQRPGFDDQNWPAAVVVDRYLPARGLRPRSIPLLTEYPMPLAVFASGRLSPGFAIGELHPTTQLPYRITLQVAAPTRLNVEVASPEGAPAPDMMTLDGERLSWTALGPERVDIYAASWDLPAGEFSLDVQSLPASGLTFGLQGDKITIPALPMSLGIQPGRRQLLGRAVTDGSAVQIAETGETLAVTLRGPSAYLVLDAGRSVHGRLLAEVHGPAGTVLDIGWADRLYQGQRPLPYPGSVAGGLWDQTDSWKLDGGQRLLTTVDTRAGRYIVISAWGEGTVRLSNLRVVETRYPAQLTGSFVSDDERINRIWQIGVDTLYSNMTDFYGETWRERGQWWGDASVTHEINQVSMGDYRLLARGLRLMAEPLALTGVPEAVAPYGGGGHLMDYAMLWVHDAAEYVRHTDDLQLVREIYPQVLQLLTYLGRYTRADGLLDIPQAHWSETDYLDTCAWWDRWGVSTAMNSLYAHTLQATAYLAERLGQTGDAQRFTAEAGRVVTGINALLYDAENGVYYATLLNGEYKPATALTQGYAMNFGVVPAEKAPVVAANLARMAKEAFDHRLTGTYAFRWILGGLGQYGYVAEGIELLRHCYGYMLDRGATTWWENFFADENFNSGLLHAWSGSPTWFLTTYVLGTQSVDGLNWTIKPALAGVGSANGALPLRNGALAVSWEVTGPGQASLSIHAPQGLSGRLILSEAYAQSTITLDGQIVWQGGPVGGPDDLGGQVEIAVAGGEHRVEIVQP